MSKRRFKAWIIQAGALPHVSEDFAIVQTPGSAELILMLGKNVENLIKEASEEASLPMPEFVYGTARLAATDPEWDGEDEYVCEHCGEIESADNRVAYNVFKRGWEEGGPNV